MPRLAQNLAELPSQDDLLSMSGLDFMQGILDGTVPGPPIGHTLGYALHAVADGEIIFRGTPEFDVTNPMGTVHGGWYGTLLDSAMACAVMTKVPAGSRLYNAGIQSEPDPRHPAGHGNRMHGPRRSRR